MRLLVYLIYLGAVFVIGGLLYERIAAFDGIIPVGLGGFEQVVVSPSEQDTPFFGSHRNMPPDVIPFSNPRVAMTALDPDTAYDVQHLPFRLSLDEVDVLESFPPRDVLEVHRRGEEPELHALTVGGDGTIDSTDFHVTAIRPWSGLLRNARGTPMAAVSLRSEDGGWGQEVLLHPDAWVFPQPDVALLFRWFTGEQAARAAAEKPPPAMTTGRWGVAEGGRVHWSNAAVPGAGFTLSDGTEVTLIEVDETPARIVVAFEHDGEARKQVAVANTQPEGPLRYEHPGLAPTAYVLDAWRDAAALVSVYREGERIATQETKSGQVFTPKAEPEPGRLEQVMAQALPVLPRDVDGEPVREVVLQFGGDTMQLREGSYEYHAGLRLRYRRAAVPPRVRYHLRARHDDGEETPFMLAPGDTERVGAWVFAQEPSFANAAEVARLEARRTLGTPAQMAGMAMVVLGAFGLVIARFKPARSDKPAPHAEIEIKGVDTAHEDDMPPPD